MAEAPFRASVAATPVERSDDPREAGLSWHTLVSGDRTPSQGLVCGVARWDPAGRLAKHRHAQAEVYFGLEGSGTVTINGMPHQIGPGICLHIPGHTWHETLAGTEGLAIFYTFPADSFADIAYDYAPEGPP